jgi:hypothetical protein
MICKISFDKSSAGRDRMNDNKIKPNPVLRAAVLEVVENQLRDCDPPQARQTYERLVAQGISKEQAKELIATVVAVEMNQMLREMNPFDRERYIVALDKLPDVSLKE